VKIPLSKSYSPLGTDVDLPVLPSLSEVIPKTKQGFFFVKVSKPLTNCLKKNQEKLQEMLAPLCALISVDTESGQVKINSCPGYESLEDWKTSCQSVTESYLKGLVSETVSFSSEIKTAVLSFIVSSIESHPQIDVKFDEENLTVTISGQKSMVEEMQNGLCKLQKVNSSSKGHSRFLPFLKSKLNILHSKTKNCRISVNEKVKVKEDFVIVEDDVMFCTTVDISNDITQFLSTTSGRNLLQSCLQSFESFFTVQFDHSGQLVLLCSSKDDGISAAKKIEEQVVLVFVPFSLPKMLLPLFKGKEWIALCSNLEETYSASIKLSSDRLTVIGDKRSLIAVKGNIQIFLDENCYIEKSIPLCWAQWRLLTTHMIEKWVKVKQKLENESMIKYVIPNKEHKEPSIVLKGGKPIVTYFVKEVKTLVFAMCTSPPIEQTRRGVVKFIYSEKGTTLIRGIEAEEKSCIQVNMLHDGMDDTTSKNCCTKLCTGRTQDGTAVTLVQGDITGFPIDVIVNAANSELKHVGGVALAIAKKGGPIIQEESDNFISREGKLHDGDAVMFKEVGKLPCKRLIHAVGPKWNGGLYNTEALFKKACLESLKLASDYRAVLFPALGSGESGFPVKKIAECMVKTFLEHCANCAFSVLHEIVVVVCDQSAISAFTQEMAQNLFNFQSALQFSASTPSDRALQEPRSKITAHPSTESRSTSCGNIISKSECDIISQFIQLHKGELLKQKVGSIGFLNHYIEYCTG